MPVPLRSGGRFVRKHFKGAMFRSRDALIIAAVALIVYGLGVWGFAECTAEACKTTSPPLVSALTLFGLGRAAVSYNFGSHPAQLVVAQYLAPYVVPFTALFATFKYAVANFRHDVHVALARYKTQHTIVCGLGETGMHVVQNLRKSGRDVVAIEVSESSANVKACEQQAIPVLTGDATDPHVLDLGGLSRASAVVVCTGQDVENVDVALRVRDLANARRGERRRRLLVLVELRSDWLFTKLIDHDKKPLGTESVELRPFNIYENAARLLVQSLKLPPAELKVRTFFVVGFGPMGRELTLHMIRAAPVPLGDKLRVLVFDRAADELGPKFKANFPAALELASVEFVKVDLQTDTPESWKIAEGHFQSEMPLGVAVCLTDDSASLYVALEMRNRLDRVGHLSVPMFVRLPYYKALGAFAAAVEKVAEFDERLRAFGSLEDLLDPDILVAERTDALARAYHQSYFGHLVASRRSGAAARPWGELPETFKMSSRRFADHLHIKLAQAGLRMQQVASPSAIELTAQEVDTLARLEHRRWTIERRLLGWSFGEIRSDVRRVNPNLTDWDRLPADVQEGNRTEIRGLPKLLADAGIELRREATIRAYGAGLARASADLARLAAGPAGHAIVLADIDQDEGRKVAEAALRLPALSLWLISSGAQQLVHRRSLDTENEIEHLIDNAEGWVHRDRVEAAG